MEWCYMLVYNGELSTGEQDFADSVRAGFHVASEMSNPIFVNVLVEYHGYVVIHESDAMPEDTDWASLILADGEGEYSL